MPKRSSTETGERRPEGGESTKESRKALLKQATAERRLLEREQLVAGKVERARQRLSEAVERLAKAQARVSRRADRLAEAESELRLRQRERTNGPHHPAGGAYDRSGRAPRKGDRSGPSTAADLRLLPAPDDADGTADDGHIDAVTAASDGPGQGAATDLGLVAEHHGDDGSRHEGGERHGDDSGGSNG